jgi:hypothetical protein
LDGARRTKAGRKRINEGLPVAPFVIPLKALANLGGNHDTYAFLSADPRVLAECITGTMEPLPAPGGRSPGRRPV